jgi:Predicted 3'-5' exonuclease related to the exonuclease domain of PolB
MFISASGGTGVIVFDIETGPLEVSVIKRQAKQFRSNLGPPPGKFDPKAVKLGNLKDEEKIKGKIEAAKAAHKKAVGDHAIKAKTDEADYWADVIDKAALSPRTGRVLAIGYYSTDKGKYVPDIAGRGNPEKRILERFWVHFLACHDGHRVMVGHNSSKFDVPFLLKRSFINNIDWPKSKGGVFAKDLALVRGGKFLNDVTFVDTMVMWGDFISLNDIATLFGVGAKPDDMDGAMFADVLKKDPQKAEAYLRNDVNMTLEVATRLGVI